jgi:hypothetical protein
MMFAVAAPLQARKKKSPASTQPTTQTAEQEAAYTATLQKRTAGILAPLHLDDADKFSRVQAIVIDEYRALNNWQQANGSAGMNPDKNAAIKALHDGFVAKLAAELTPEQVETVKDGMTANKVRVTYDAYCQIVPNLTDEEKAKILDLLKQAREEAIDGTSMEDKSSIFKRYRGKINIYLTANGHDVAKAYKDWGEAQKSKKSDKSAGASTEPAQ